MFRGITEINLDNKGRVSIPVRYRERLQADCEGKLVVTIDTDVNCLLLYPLPEWELIEEKVQALPSFNRAARRIQRLLMGHATELEVDGNGRILLPPLLRDYAHLEKEIMLVGQGKKFEIWSKHHWEQGRDTWLNESGDEISELPEGMKELAL
ncbi:MAG: division/cell wall cluster transcriptional repressor MraZ [Proteobacteria bacterium]|nr:division/cell wall cluster transcriptional repressor MraZ [Pseudomonadota bacterium]